MKWLDAPTQEGLWWVITIGETEPRLVNVSDIHEEDGKTCFAAGYFGTPEQSYAHHFRGARWHECVPPAGEPAKRDPDPTAPGAPGERVERRG